MRGSLALPIATPISAPNPSLVISFGPNTSTFSPSADNFRHRSAISAGFNTFAGSLTKSRLRNTPSATAFSPTQASRALAISPVITETFASFGLSSAFSVVRYRSNRYPRSVIPIATLAACAPLNPTVETPAAASRAKAAVACPPASSRNRPSIPASLPNPTATTRDSPAPGARTVTTCPRFPLNSAAAKARETAPPVAASAASNSPEVGDPAAAPSSSNRTSAPDLGKPGLANAISSMANAPVRKTVCAGL